MLDPRSAWALLGDGRPAGGHGPAADAAVRGLGRGGPSSPRPHACGVLGGLRVELARPAAAGLARLAPRALPSALRSAGFFAALCRALWSGIRRTGFGWGRARLHSPHLFHIDNTDQRRYFYSWLMSIDLSNARDDICNTPF